jgi:gamma-glutamyltranspeptidase/glutathione hydrolase
VSERQLYRIPKRVLTTVLALAAVGSLTRCTGPDADQLSSGPVEIRIPSDWRFADAQPPVSARNGVVSSTDEYASQAGLDILQAGGNAVDAAIATHFALAVVNPSAGNIGGGGFMIVRMADGTKLALNFREKAPLAAYQDMFLDEHGNVTGSALTGARAPGVPGSVMGMWQAHRRFGSLPWEDLLQPAIGLADGHVLEERLASSLSGAGESLREFTSTAEIFLPGGKVPQLGEVFRQTDLAATLRRVAAEGPDDFYRGKTADLILAEMKRGDGLITREDLQIYTAEWVEPVVIDYRGYKIISMAPPSSGGATMGEIAHILEGHDLRALGFHTPEMIHLYTEAAKLAYADRNTYLGDPKFVTMPLTRMTSTEYAAERRAMIDITRATPSSEINPGMGEPPIESPETTHYSVVDGEGNAVSVTTTIRSGFGSRLTVTGAGFLLNETQGDFATKPGFPNSQGLVTGFNNAVGPERRPLSSMTPTIVEDPSGRLFFVTGSPGGGTIINTVFQTISNLVDFDMNIVEAVNAPRIHHQHLPDELRYEQGGLDAETITALRALGHNLVERTSQGDVQAIMAMPDGSYQAWSDLRRGGRALGY